MIKRTYFWSVYIGFNDGEPCRVSGFLITKGWFPSKVQDIRDKIEAGIVERNDDVTDRPFFRDQIVFVSFNRVK